jgi:hypothetical protein
MNGLGETNRDQAFADPVFSVKEIGMGQPAGFHRRTQDSFGPLMTDDVAKGHEDLALSWSGPSCSKSGGSDSQSLQTLLHLGEHLAGDLVGRSARIDAAESAWLALCQGEKPAPHPLMKLLGFSVQPILPF